MYREIIIQRIHDFGESIIKYFPENTDEKNVIKEVLQSGPTPELPEYPSFTYLANELGLLDEELERILNSIHLKIIRCVFISERCSTSELLTIKLKKKTSFYFHLRNGQTIAFNLDCFERLNIGDMVFNNCFPEEINGKPFKVKDHLVEIDLHELTHVYFLSEVSSA